jgi:hypothetical protein
MLMYTTGDPPSWSPPSPYYPPTHAPVIYPNGGMGLDSKINELIEAMNRLSAALEKFQKP